MSSALFSVSRQSFSHRSLSGREQRPREVEQFSRKSSFVGSSINHKGDQSRSSWNALHGVTVRKKKSCKNPTQIMEDKENSGKQPVQVNPVERTGTTVLQTIMSPNLCAASVISKDLENLRLEEEKSLSLEQNTVAISRSHSLVKSVADKHSVTDTGNAGAEIAKKAMHGLEKLNSDAKLMKKPIRGVFRGKVVQSKVSSFWKVSDESQAKASVLSNNLTKSQPSNNLTAGLGNIEHFTIKSSRKESNCPLDKAHSVGLSKRPAKHSASTVQPAGKKQSSVPARMTTVSNYVKLCSTAFSAHGTAPQLNSCSDLDKKTKPTTATELPIGKMHPSRLFKVCKESTKKQLSTASAELPNGKMHPSKSFNVCKDIKSKEKPLSTVTVGKISCRPPVKQCLPTGQGDAPRARQSRVSKTTTLASSATISAPFRPKTVSEILTAASIRFVHPKESAEEQRARLARWQASKGKVMKRPPMVKMKVLPLDVHKETVQFIPEHVNDDLQRLSKEEADEKDSDCTKLNQQHGRELEPASAQGRGSSPGDRNVKISWDENQEPMNCSDQNQEHGREPEPESARGRGSSLGDRNVEIGWDEDQEPMNGSDRNLTVDMLHNIPPNQSMDSPKYEKVELGKEEQNNNGEVEEGLKHLVKNEGLIDHETKSEVNTTFEMPKTEKSSKKKLNLRRAYQKAEDDKDGEAQFITCSQFMSPDNESEGSSVIRFNVRTTPSLKSLSNNMHSQLGDSTFKDFKFLTPVRRSLRIERKSFRLPEMLHDHDPCLSSLGELAELEGDVNAYIFRENNALRDLAKNANQQKEK